MVGALLLDRHPPEGQGDQRARTEPGDPWDDASGPRLLCARCGHAVTAGDWAISKAGAHGHSFINPHGYLFHIGCFRLAPGCVPRGDEHSEYSWFPGYAWCMAHCAGCEAHLGWSFSGSGLPFFGLILDRLVQRMEPGSATA